MGNVSRRLVVDASVLHSAGGKPGHSDHCRQMLVDVLELGHCAVTCPEIRDEWNRHQSTFARKWRVDMVSRKQLRSINIEIHRQRIEVRIDGLQDVSVAKLKALRKDVHMLAAAAHADRVLVSGDHELKTLCDAHLTESVEWLLTIDEASDTDRRAQLDRLAELTRPKPHPALPL
jgi:hypothetical protein